MLTSAPTTALNELSMTRAHALGLRLPLEEETSVSSILPLLFEVSEFIMLALMACF
jgi:hypothetical protein